MSEENHKIQSKQAVAYSALTLVLLLFILQSGFGMVVNILRNIDIYAKLQIVGRANKFAIKKNRNLKYELKSFNSAKSLEAIARNNLKMAGPNEILLIVNAEDFSKDKKSEKAEKEKGIFLRR